MSGTACALAIFILFTSAMSSSVSSLASEVQAALLMHKTGNVDDALAAYSLIIPRLPPGQLASTLNSNAGSILLARGDYTSAVDHFAAAVAADPQSSQARFNLAVTLSSKFSKDDEALKHCIAAVRLDTRNHKGISTST